MPERSQFRENQDSRPEQTLFDAEAEMKKLLEWAAIKKPLVLAQQLEDPSTSTTSSAFIGILAKELEENNERGAAIILAETEKSLRQIADPLLKTKMFVQIIALLAKHDYAEKALSLTTEIYSETGLGSIKDEDKKVDQLIDLGQAIRPIDPDKASGLVGEAVKRTGVAVKEGWQKVGIAEKLFENGFSEAGKQVTDFIYENMLLSEIVHFLTDKGFLNQAKELAPRTHHDYYLINLAEALLKTEQIEDAVSIASLLIPSGFEKNLAVGLIRRGRIKEGLRLVRGDTGCPEVIEALAEIGLKSKAMELTAALTTDWDIVEAVGALARFLTPAESLAFIQTLPKKVNSASGEKQLNKFSLLTTIAFAYYGKQNPQMSKNNLGQILEATEEEKAVDKEKVYLLAKLSNFFDRLGDQEKAGKIAQEALEIAKEIGSAEVILDVLVIDFAIWAKMGKLAKLSNTLKEILPALKIELQGNKLGYLLDAAEVFEKAGEENEAKQLTELVFEQAKNLADAGALLHVNQGLIGRGEMEKAAEIAAKIKESGFYEILVKRFIAAKREDLAFKIASSFSVERISSWIDPLIQTGQTKEVLELLDKVSDQGELEKIAGRSINFEQPAIIMAILDRLDDGIDRSLILNIMIDQGYTFLAWEVLQRIQVQDTDARSLQELVSLGYEREVLGLVQHIPGYPREAVLQKLADRKVEGLIAVYAEKRKSTGVLTETSVINYQGLIDHFRSSGTRPSEEILESLILAGASPWRMEQFIALFPQTERAGLEKRYQVFSGYRLAGLLKGLIYPELIEFLEKSPINFSRLARQWRKYGQTSTFSLIFSFLDNIEKIKDLESQAPGSASILHEKFGLTFFSRYPQEMLLAMYQERNEQRPYGIILAGKADWNGAFNRNEKMWADFYHQIKDKYLVRIIEAGSKGEISLRLAGLNRRYDQKIAFMILAAHGSVSAMYFGQGSQSVVAVADLESRASQKLKERYYAPGMPFAFISCSTGAENGLAQKFSEVFSTNTVGPKIPTSGEKITPVFSNGQIISLHVTYNPPNTEQSFSVGFLR